jgi:hypothetical protein
MEVSFEACELPFSCEREVCVTSKPREAHSQRHGNWGPEALELPTDAWRKREPAEPIPVGVHHPPTEATHLGDHYLCGGTSLSADAVASGPHGSDPFSWRPQFAALASGRWLFRGGMSF